MPIDLFRGLTCCLVYSSQYVKYQLVTVGPCFEKVASIVLHELAIDERLLHGPHKPVPADLLQYRQELDFLYRIP